VLNNTPTTKATIVTTKKSTALINFTCFYLIRVVEACPTFINDSLL
jgi:hypothetical protein